MKIRLSLFLAILIALPVSAMQKPKSELHLAAGNRHQADTVEDILLYDEIDVNDRDGDNNTPLHDAASNGCIANAIILIEYGANINARSRSGETPLDKALSRNHTDLVALLLDLGAQPGQNHQAGTRPQPAQQNRPTQQPPTRTPQARPQPRNNHPEGKTRLHLEAATKGHAPQVLEILEREGAQATNAQDNYGNTPLHEACYFGCSASVRHLLTYGADAQARNNDGHTPFDKASFTNQQNILTILYDHTGTRPQAQQQRRPAATQPRPQIQPARPQAPAQQQRNPGHAQCIFQNLLHLPGLTGGALRLPVPVYHVLSNARVAENQDWCCAFHTLNNAMKLERQIGHNHIDPQVFKNACTRHAPRRDLRNGSTGDTSLKIARQIGIPHFYNLIFERGASSLSEDHDRNEDRVWQQLRTTFLQSRGPICIHFDCDIKSRSAQNPRHQEPHSILVAAIKMDDGAVAIYIFDNVNDDEHQQSQEQIRKHVENIYRRLIG